MFADADYDEVVAGVAEQAKNIVVAPGTVSRASAHNYLRARDCPDRRDPVTERCRECTRSEPTVAPVWTHADVTQAMRAWTERHGAPPRDRDWTPNRERPGRWEAESPSWPSAAVVGALFGQWNVALTIASSSSG